MLGGPGFTQLHAAYLLSVSIQVQDQLDDETIFPSKIGVPFPKNFQSIAKTILKVNLSERQVLHCTFNKTLKRVNYAIALDSVHATNLFFLITQRLFRVYAHIYHVHFAEVIRLQEEAHLNTSFKHFIYFVQEFGLIEKKELAPLSELIERLVHREAAASSSSSSAMYMGAGVGGAASSLVGSPTN